MNGILVLVSYKKVNISIQKERDGVERVKLRTEQFARKQENSL